MTTAVNTQIIQYIAIAGSLVLFGFIVHLLRKKKLREEYSILWLFFSSILIILSIWRSGLEMFSTLIGIAYPPSTILLVLIMAVYFILIQFSLVITKLAQQNKELIQEIGLLREEMKRHIKK